MYICIPENNLSIDSYIFGSWNNWSQPINIDNFDFKISSYLFYYVGEIEEVEYKLKTGENFYLVNDNFYLTRIVGGFTNNVSMSKGKNIFWNGKIEIRICDNRIIVCLIDRIIFEGNFDNGLVNGKGIYYHRNGKIQYEGNIQNGIIHGYGTTFDQNGKILHQGKYIHNMLHGYCILYDENERKIYEGEFTNGMRHGFGSTFYDGDVMEFMGEFSNNVKNGEGKLFSESGILRYKGYFSNDFFHGQGVLYWPNTEKLQYEGSFRNGDFHGIGISYNEEGQIEYGGVFRNNLPHGHGIAYFPDGKKMFEGIFKNGTSQEGIMFYTNGTSSETNKTGFLSFNRSFNEEIV